ncbi:putative aldo-keto reductase [Xylogone sp. PMI_703]|nr:putative aldo-keto reductase [Xylogone sp. PMI_703]
MPNVKKVAQLGKDGPVVDRLGYGLMGLSTAYGAPMPDAERFAVLDAIYDSGERFWDSADIYGDSEDLLGKWFKSRPGKRENIFLATKFGNVLQPDGTVIVRGDPEYVQQACEKSLKRLGVSTIDLYYCHRLDTTVPIEKTVQAMAKLKEEGKIKYLGLSECSAESLRRAYKVHPITAVQLEYSPFFMDIEHPNINLIQTCRELGVAVVAYSPLGRGLLTGKFRSPNDFPENDFRRFIPRFSEENFPKCLELVDSIGALAKKKGCTPSQLTLAWVLAQGPDIFPIPGTTNIGRFNENMQALEITISDDENQAIRELAEKAALQGERYPAFMLPNLFADTPAL